MVRWMWWIRLPSAVLTPKRRAAPLLRKILNIDWLIGQRVGREHVVAAPRSEPARRERPPP
ncbi:chemotaxis-specific methylesterase, partial [Pseudomonas savastanoi pv. glycinea str. race 4]